MSAMFESGKSAVISPCGKYRYLLTRRWDAGRRCVFVMLNPSTADANVDDPTIRRCIGFAKREKCGGLAVLNLYALRATDPKELRMAPDLQGPNDENYKYLEAAVEPEALLVAAWGVRPTAPPIQRFLLAHLDHPMYALRLTKDGHPGHPLYVPASAELVPFNDAARSRGKQ